MSYQLYPPRAVELSAFKSSSSHLKKGVFGDEVKSVSVIEGESVTLHTDVVKQTAELIKWTYGPGNTFIGRINGKANSTMFSDDERYKGRLNLEGHTGSLTIKNITTVHSGLYTFKISRNNKASYKQFIIVVYARLPVPLIIRDSSADPSSSNCSVLCSVMNVSHDVSVSWYKGKSLLSSISVSDLNIRLSLPLEVEYQDTNTYRCVVNNPITNLTQHLNITQLCHTCEASPATAATITAAVFALVLCMVCMITICVCKRKAAYDKAFLIKTSHAKVPLSDEERSIREHI